MKKYDSMHEISHFKHFALLDPVQTILKYGNWRYGNSRAIELRNTEKKQLNYGNQTYNLQSNLVIRLNKKCIFYPNLIIQFYPITLVELLVFKSFIHFCCVHISLSRYFFQYFLKLTEFSVWCRGIGNVC